MRDHPINARALDAAKLARCAGPKRADVIDLISARLKEWWLDDNPRKLVAIVTGANLLTPPTADTCLKDAPLADAIMRQRAAEVPLKLDVVPVFFVNGARYENEFPADAVAKLLPADVTTVAASAAPPGAVLQVIGACDLVAAHDPVAVSSIKTADAQLVALAVANLQLGSGYRGFRGACPALKGPDPSPAMDRFRMRTFELGIFRGRVSEQAAALRSLLKTEPLASLSRRGRANEADHCAFTIAAVSDELLKQSDALLKSAQVACPTGKP
jgi:hypothetical protein